MKAQWFVAAILALTIAVPALAEEPERYDGPIIDMHLHGPIAEGWGPPIETWLEKLDQFNVKKVALSAYPDQLSAWVPKAPNQLIPSLMFPCLTQAVEQCFPDEANLPEVTWLREEIRAGRIQMLGEVISQLYGIFPSDSVLEPYFALAEEFDIPFGLHMGPGPVWGVSTSSIYAQFPDFQISAGNPLELEEVLRRHPNLRLFIMHAGWPMVDEILAILWHNPNVYVELGHLQIAINRAEYNHYLKRLVDAGFGDRVMFGSDVDLETFGRGIQAIFDAEFLTAEQKADILYNNAARFLRLSKEEIAAHHRK